MRQLDKFKWGAVFSALMLTAPMSASASIYSQQECAEIATFVNGSLPMNVDQYTILTSSTCVVIGGMATFTYNYELTFQPSGKLPDEFRQKVTNRFCSNPETRQFLDGLSYVHMDYFLPNGTFYDRIKFSKTNCPR